MKITIFGAAVLSALFVSSFVAATTVSNRNYLEYQRLEEWKARFGVHRTHALKDGTDDVYLKFATQQAALDWMNANKAQFMQSFGAKKYDVVPLTDPRYATLQQYVHQMWLGYLQLFPTQTSGLSEPPVILVDTEVVNAFVGKDSQTNKIAHAVIVFTGFLDMVGGLNNADPIRGTFAHELAHDVFKHLLPQFQTPINKFYLESQERVGFRAPHDSSLDEPMATWISDAGMAGDMTLPELMDLPSNGMARPLSARVWLQLNKDLYDQSSQCTQASQTIKDWAALSPFSLFEGAFTVAANDLPAFGQSSQKVIEDTTSCLAGKKKAFSDVASEVLGIPAAQLQTDQSFQKMATTFDGATDLMAGLRAIVSNPRKEMAGIETKLPFNDLGYFTYEEHADDMSVIVSRQLGLNPLGISTFFTVYLQKTDPKVWAECQTVIEAGTLAPHGEFSDPHRAYCYRIVHLNDLNKLIDQSPDVQTFAKEYVNQTIGG